MNNAKITVDTTKLKSRLQTIKRDFPIDNKEIMYEITLAGSERAMKYTPPPAPRNGSASPTIPKEYYIRRIYDLNAVLRHEQKILDARGKAFLSKSQFNYVINKLKQARQRGDKYFAVRLSWKKKRGVIAGIYTAKNKKTLQTQWGKIKYRGLWKIMYGLKYLKLGFSNPRFARLLSKSPEASTQQHFQDLRCITGVDFVKVSNANSLIPSGLMGIHKRLIQGAMGQKWRNIKKKIKKECLKK